MKFLRTSRRDDIMSLFYLMIYLLGDNQFMIGKPEGDMQEKFGRYKAFKQKVSYEQMVHDLSERLDMSKDFAKEENLNQYKSLIIKTLTILARST